VAATSTIALPVVSRHPYEAQLDALEDVLGADLVAGALGMGPLTSAAELAMALERYRTTLLEPIELPALTNARRLASRGRTKELIALDQKFLGHPPEWLPLAAGSTRFGRDALARLRPLRDERVVQRMLEAVQTGKTPGHHPIVFGLTMAIYAIPERQGLADYAQGALAAVIASAAGKLKLTQEDRAALLAPSQAHLPQAISRMVA
jgi:urease accessory protein UreF